ncbi:MAG: phosphotransferase family protein [Novosphingobium sp.]|nr:phosphotransferase family protein [Novosphingobium sp.]
MEADLDDIAPAGPLTEWLDAHVPQLGSGPLERKIISGGTSNIVLSVDRGEGPMVLRRPPAVPPPGAERGVLREARVLTALNQTDVPHPEAYGSCEDPDVIGMRFYIMEMIQGWAPNIRDEVIHYEEPFDRMPYQYGIAHAIVGGLIQLANVDYKAIGLEGYGKPDNFLERQVDRWSSQLKSYPERYKGYEARTLEGYDVVEKWLRDNVRATKHPGILHGDVGTPNMMFKFGPPARLAAMIDWELSTVGDPMIDMGWFCGGMHDERFPELSQKTGLHNPDFMPTKQEMGRYYCAGTGRDIAEFDYYLVLAGFKSGCILEYKVAQAEAGQLPKDVGRWFSEMVESNFKKNAEFVRRIS